ncbi:hypothetical protein GCM10020219_081950 [Nonomuraea dietziae]
MERPPWLHAVRPLRRCFGRYSVDRSDGKGGPVGPHPADPGRRQGDGRRPGVSRAHPRAPHGATSTPRPHLDWTPAARRCGYDSVAWPTSVVPEQAGLRDSFRVAHPDPVAEPGVTWSPVYPTFTGATGTTPTRASPEPQDRIDFIHYKGALEVASSAAVVEGAPTAIPNHKDNAWTSDHAAVLTVFTLSR